MKKVLFLDIDGVLNSRASAVETKFRKLGSRELYCFQQLLKRDPDFKIVISSTWRMHGMEKLMTDLFVGTGIAGRVIGATPVLQTIRGLEIDAWLKKHPEVTSYVIVDDDRDMDMHSHRLVKTSGEVGFTEDDVERVVKMFATPCPRVAVAEPEPSRVLSARWSSSV